MRLKTKTNHKEFLPWSNLQLFLLARSGRIQFVWIRILTHTREEIWILIWTGRKCKDWMRIWILKKKIWILHPFPQHSPFVPKISTHIKRENPLRKPNLLRLEPIVYGPDISYVFVYRSRTYTVASANRDRLGFCAHKNWDTPIMAFYFLAIQNYKNLNFLRQKKYKKVIALFL